MIYLDSAATSYYRPREVAEAVTEAMENFGNSGRGAHEASLHASRIIYDTRQLVAELFGAGDPSRVAFTANSTESLNMAIQGVFCPGDHVITTAMEHNSVLRPLYLMEERGVSLTILPADNKGRISYEDMENAITDNTKGIVCTHASNLTGNLVDLLRVGELCKARGLLFLVDASQTAGVCEIDMEKMGIDILCFTGHKSLMGPQGTGGICVRESVRVSPLLVGGSGINSSQKRHPSQMPTALEAGTINGHGIAGLHAALLYGRRIGMDDIRNRKQLLAQRFYDRVLQIPGVKLYGDFSTTMRAPVIALNIRDYDSGEIADQLAVRYDICTRAGAHCAPLLHQALGTEGQGAVRFSMSYFNTEHEIDIAARAVAELSEE